MMYTLANQLFRELETPNYAIIVVLLTDCQFVRKAMNQYVIIKH